MLLMVAAMVSVWLGGEGWLVVGDPRSIGEGEGRVVVSFSVDWCPGSARMDREVWSDEGLMEELGSRARLVRVGEGALGEAMDRFGVRGFPTLVMFEDGEEVGRLHGYRDRGSVLAWFGDPGRGVEGVDVWGVPIGDLHDVGVDALLDERWGDAGEAMSAFWVRSLSDGGMTDTLRWLRRDRYRGMLGRVAQDPEGRVWVEGLLGAFGEDGPGEEGVMARDWVVLMGVLGREEEVDGWIDGVMESGEFDRFGDARGVVFDRLLARGLERGAGLMVDGSVWERWVALARGDEVAGVPERVLDRERAGSGAKLGEIARVLRLVGRDEEAEALERVVEG